MELRSLGTEAEFLSTPTFPPLKMMTAAMRSTRPSLVRPPGVAVNHCPPPSSRLTYYGSERGELCSDGSNTNVLGCC